MDQHDDSRTLVVERELSHPPEKVWRALTESVLIDEWLMANDFQPIIGHRFQLRAAPTPNWDGVVYGEVLAVDRYKRLSYRWDAAPALKTVVTWTLTPLDGGTQLRMEQSGFGPDDDANFRGAGYGWQKFINSLDRVLSELQ